jgi:ribosomal protein S18 acetylase RimI-like enzyme
MGIRQYEDQDYDAVVELYSACFDYPAPHNNPHLSIRRKTMMGDGLFFVSQTGKKISGAVMAGWDGHRGWIYSLAVHPEFRNRGIGGALVNQTVTELEKRDCPKVNLQVLPGNNQVIGFYAKHGFQVEERISMGRCLYE